MTSKTVRDYERVRDLIRSVRCKGQAVVPEPEAKTILNSYGIAIPRGGFCTSLSEVREVAGRLAYPLALKVVSPDILHKSAVGGVALNLSSEAAIRDAYYRITSEVRKRLPDARVTGILIEEMVPSSVEVVVSVAQNPQLGPVLMVGLGGLWVETLRDVSFRLIPLDRVDVVEMLDELRAAPILARALGSVVENGLVDALLALGEFGQRFGDEIQEVEINPLAVTREGVCAVDAVILLGTKS